MHRVIVFPSKNGGYSVVHAPSDDADLAEIAKLTVPEGVEYQVVDYPNGEGEWFFDGTSFVPQPLDALKATALSQMDAAHANYLRLLTGSASPEERDTWTVKEDAATAYLADAATDAQKAMIEAEAAGGGITPTQLAQTIKAKATAFLTLVGQASGLRAKGRAAIKAATTPEELEAVLTALDAEAQAVAAAIAGGQS